jgi:hypothetical protein
MADHDQRLKIVLRELLPEFQELILPDWTGRFDLTAPQWQPQEVFLNPPQGERRLLDLVALVGVTQPVQGANQTVLHIEIESGDSLTDLRSRMPRYHPALTFRYNVPVLSLALYLGVALEGRGWDEAREDYWEASLGSTRWAYLGLPGLDARTYVEGDNLLGVALSVLMNCPEDRRVWLKARAMQRLAQANLTAAHRFLLMEVVEAYLPLVGPHLQEYERLLLTEDFQMVRVLAQTTFEKGEESGMVKGQRALLLHQLEKSFGPLSTTARARLEAWPAGQLLQLGDDILTKKSLVELGLEDAPNGTAAPAS